jgi:zinc/manganese transport system substrate-binding protein
MSKKLFLVFLLTGLFTTAHAGIPVVATTTSAEMLLREIGGNAVDITTLAAPDRDAHTLQVKPSMMRALRGAKLVVAIGAELEIGWLPPAIQSSANPAILPGTNGYFEIAAQVPLLDVKGAAAADRAKGDIHPMGNPHVQMDPVRMADAGIALAERLGHFDAANAGNFKQRAQAFKQSVTKRLPQWQEKTAHTQGVILYHKDGDYLMNRLSVPILAYIEPLPGLPPTASHLATLVKQNRDKKGVILHTTFQNSAGIETLAKQLGWNSMALPLDPPRNADGKAYFAMIDAWANAFQSASSH